MKWSRRRLLSTAGMMAGASAAGILKSVAAEEKTVSRRIALKSLHTPE